MTRIRQSFFLVGLFSWSVWFVLPPSAASGSDDANDSLDGWLYLTEFPYAYSDSSQSWYYFSVSSNTLWAYDFGNSNWLKIQDGEGTIPPTYNDGFTASVLEAQSNPSSYGLYSSSEYESATTASYSEGYTAGFDALTPQPNSNGYAPTSLVNKQFLVVDQDGLILRWVFKSDGFLGTSYSTAGNSSFMYVYNKTADNAASLTFNTGAAATVTTVTFTSSGGGTLVYTAKDIFDGSVLGSGTATFTITD